MDTARDEYYVYKADGAKELEDVLNKGVSQGWKPAYVLGTTPVFTVVFVNEAPAVDPTSDKHSAFDEEPVQKAVDFTVKGLLSHDKIDVVSAYRRRGWEIVDQVVHTPKGSSIHYTYDITFTKI